MTDKDRILAHFRNSGGRLISCSELVDGRFYGTKRIIEYSGRITDARKEVGCTCGQDKDTCTADEHIRNVKTNWYQYSSIKKEEVKNAPTLDVNGVSIRINNLKADLESYRGLYVKMRAEGNTRELKEIESKAKLKKVQIALLEKSLPDGRINQVMEALL